MKNEGNEKAEENLKYHLKNIIGFFDKKKTVYILDSLNHCQLRSILAHEIVHYFQIKMYGPATSDPYGLDMGISMWAREMRAYSLQEKYEKEFCE